MTEEERAALEAEQARLQEQLEPITKRLAEIHELLRPPPKDRVKLRYWRHHAPQEDEHDTVADAVGTAVYMESYGTAAPECIVLPDGTKLERADWPKTGSLDRLMAEYQATHAPWC